MSKSRMVLVTSPESVSSLTRFSAIRTPGSGRRPSRRFDGALEPPRHLTEFPDSTGSISSRFGGGSAFHVPCQCSDVVTTYDPPSFENYINRYKVQNENI